jgi:ubiquinone/menaquinone biosynthesis C-methylase UbiE
MIQGTRAAELDAASTSTVGAVLHSARRYDWIVQLRTLGRERQLRERMLSFARLEPGDRVLDVGCGTGTLAIAAKRQVGPTGTVCGIDPSPEMLARAQRKALRAGVEVKFDRATAQELPSPDAHFDVVLSTLMFHHLPRQAREDCAREMRRVVKPGGRILVVDFASMESTTRGLLAHFHRHGHTKPTAIIATLARAGLTDVESGSLGAHDLHFVLVTAPGGS